MQKKTIRRLAAAGVLSVAVAATLVYVGTRDPGESLTYNELLALAGDEQAAASVEAELEATSNLEENSALSRLLEEIEAEDASAASEEADSAASEENTASEAESEASTSSEAASSSKSEAAASSKTASSAVSGASHSTAAPERDYSSSSSAHTASSAAHSTAASASHSTAESHAAASSKAETTCDEQLAACIREIEALQTRSEKELYGIIYDAYDEYMGHPASERNLMLKISVVLSKSGELNKAQSACDKEFKEIVTEMRKILKDNGRDQTLADEAERTYKQKKNAMIKELTDQAYSGGDGSGQSGKWLAEKAGKLS